MRGILLAGFCALVLAGCQTPQDPYESYMDAALICQGRYQLKPGTRAYTRCRDGLYQEKRREAEEIAESNREAAEAAAVGITLGVLAAGAAGAAAASPRYHHRYYH